MSDLIDFDNPNPKNDRPALASPLIPAPEIISTNDEPGPSEAGPQFLVPRQSFENNPFDMIMKQVTEYEKNKEDPFETVIEKAMEFHEPNIDLMAGDAKPKNDEQQKKNDLVQEENKDSITIDLLATNFTADHNKASTDVLLTCDNKLPCINVSPVSCKADLSILSISAMDDSFLVCDSNVMIDEKNGPVDSCLTRRRSKSQTEYLNVPTKSPRARHKRISSVTDCLKNSAFGENSTLYLSNISSNPINNAFVKSSFQSSDSNDLSNQFNLSTNKQKIDRLNSDSSINLGLSNLSIIPMDSSNRLRQERFCSESSAVSGISNISIIPTNVESSCSNLSVFSSDNMNMAFVTSKSSFNSASFSVENVSQTSSKKSDLIKKYQEIKKRMSTQIEFANDENKEELTKDQKDFLPNFTSLDKKEGDQNSIEKLVDINNSSNSVFSDDVNVNEIIVKEAKSLAEMLDKLSSSNESNVTPDDNLLFSNTQLNFDDLPLSDDEIVDDLIDLPQSPLKSVNTIKNHKQKDLCKTENIKILENEVIEDNLNKKTAATALLLDLQKIINKDNNLDACKVLDDLKKVLGVECDDNTQIIQNSLQNVQEDKNKLIPLDIVENNTSVTNESLENKGSKKNISGSDDIVNDKKDSTNNNSKINNECNSDIKLISAEVEDESLAEIKSENLENNLGDQKLAKTLLSTLNKIVNKKDEDNVVDFLSSLGSILNMATELRTKNKEIVGLQETDEKMSKEVLPSLNISSKTNNLKTDSGKQKNQSYEGSTKRRSGVVINNFSNTLSSAKNKRNSHLNMKRFSSNPELVDKKKNENRASSDKKSTLVASIATSELIKAKFKKKINTDIIKKKGPLKAMIPLGNMQKQASIEKISPPVSVTPPKSDALPLGIPSSTPNNGRSLKYSKTNPKASSTPNAGETKQLPKLLQRKDFKSNSENNLSCVSLNSSLKERSSIYRSDRRLDRTLSPQKKLQMPKKNSPNGSESRLPRYSPRAVRTRNHSFNDLRTTAKSPTKIGIAKFQLDKKFQRQSFLSPLRNSNKLEQGRPTNLVSKLGRFSMQIGPEKENYT